MPRATLNPDKAKQGGGVEPGNYEVTGATFRNVKTDYRPNQLKLILSLATLDKDGDPVRGADPVDLELGFGEKSLEVFHPGQASSPNGDPDDAGTDPEAEGNTIYCDGNGQFSKSCGALVFIESLAKAGFPKSTLDQCWAPSFIGMKFALDAKSPMEVNSRYGLRLNTKPMKDRQTGEDVNITYKVADKWLNPNYLTNGTGGPAKDKGAAAAEKATEPEDIAKAILTTLSHSRRGDKNTIKTQKALMGFAVNEFTKAKYPQPKLKAVQALFADADWLVGEVSELGGSYIDGATSFPEIGGGA